jgi:cholesterol transport system auxiliary component
MKRLMVVITLSLCGCTGSFFESKSPVPQVYVLAAAAPAAEGEALKIDIAIGFPSTAPGLDTERVAVLRGANQLDYYSGAMWGDSAPHIVQYLLVSSLQRSNKFHSVTSEQARVAADYVLDIDLQDFQAEYDAQSQPTAHVTLAVSLLRIKDRKLIGNWRISAAVPASNNRLSAVIEAFQAASQQVAAQVGASAAAAIGESGGR